MTLLVIGSSRAPTFAASLRRLDPGLDVRVWPDHGEPAGIDVALAWGPPPGALAKLPRLGLIVSVGAGVDHLFRDPELPQVPIVRYVDADLTGRMTEYIVLHVILHHRRMSEFLEFQRNRVWRYVPEPAAHQVRVGIMGLGVLGAAAAEALSGFGYRLRGWSRTRKSVSGVECFAGIDELPAFLAGTDILAVLLPLTPDTRGIVDARLLAGLSRTGRDARLPGPVLINAGRGGLQVEADILAALAGGALYAATLDVFETEPLPHSSPLWGHPRVIITPHNSAESDPDAIAAYCLRQVRARMEGRPLENLVDRQRQY